jgi:CDP-6-deoxy-D-xylo-4-hexulose-3-dehydrase
MSIEELRKIIPDVLKSKVKAFIPGKSKVAVTKPLYDENDAIGLMDTFFSGWLSMSEKVKTFEERFSKFLGVKHSIAVNSGSSANLLALTTLFCNDVPSESRLKAGDEIITPAVTWPTTCYPILQVGAIPVFVDVDPETYCIDPNEVEKAISPKTKAIFLVHLLGHSVNMSRIMEIAERYDLLVIEDSCEALGTKFKGKFAGTFGDLSTFSFFETHHISTGEGGMVCTDNTLYSILTRSFRAFGRVCTCPVCLTHKKPPEPCPLRHKYDIPGLKGYDRRYVFTQIGYSLKMTELQASLGITQLDKLDGFLEARKRNAKYYTSQLKSYPYLQLPTEKPYTKHSWFMYPIIVRPEAPFTKNQLVEYLERNHIETRSIMAAMTSQPSLAHSSVRYKKIGMLPVTENIKNNGFAIGCHPKITASEREYVVQVITNFLESSKHLNL